MFKRILIPTDGSPLATKAAKAGIALAKAVGARVVGCSVAEVVQPVFGARGMVSRQMIDEFNRNNRDAGQRHVDAIGRIAARLGVPFTPVVSTDHPPHEGIAKVAKKHRCDVIVMGTHGRSGLNKLVMGSVAQKVLTHSALPVLVYR
jgi:nucleotide-binding universal stress UspA family protein